MKVHWTDTAEGHLDAIYAYIAQCKHNTKGTFEPGEEALFKKLTFSTDSLDLEEIL